jgi:site-specific recombinase XerD
MFRWKVASPNTMRAYHSAARDFANVTGISAAQADPALLATWQASMEARGLSANTIRARLSAVAVISGVKVQLPKKNKAVAFTMSDDQVKAFFQKIEKDTDRALMASLFLTGRQPNSDAHWLSSSRTLTTQEITRKIKRYARLAGLNETQINLRSFTRIGQQMIKKYSADYVAEHLLVRPVQPMVEWKKLHGIGRRSRRAVKI